MADSTNEIQLDEIEVDALTQMITGACPHLTAAGMKPYIYMNDRTNPAPAFLLDMFYNGVFTNKLGVMVAKNVETSEEETILVGVVINDDGTEAAFPVAKVLGQEAFDMYAIPNGEGYVRPSAETSIEA